MTLIKQHNWKMNPKRSWCVCFQANFQELLRGDVEWKTWSKKCKITSCNVKSQRLEQHAVNVQPACKGLATEMKKATRSILFQAKKFWQDIHLTKMYLVNLYLHFHKAHHPVPTSGFLILLFLWQLFAFQSNQTNHEKTLRMVNWFPVLYPHHTALLYSKGTQCFKLYHVSK